MGYSYQNVRYSRDYNYEAWAASKQGVNNGRAVFTEDQVRYIRALYSGGSSIASIVKIFYPDLQTAKEYHRIHSTFYNICKEYTWKNIL